MLKNLTNKKKKKGFTLIELIIVIAIIAILAVLAIPKFGQARKSAAEKSDIANAKTIANAAVTLYADDKVEDGAADAVSTTSTGNGKKVADYLQNVPKTKAKHGDSEKNSEFYVAIDGGNVEVRVGNATGNKLFPAP